MDTLLSAIPRLHPETGVERVGDRLLAAGPDDALHTFEDERGERSEVAERIVELSDGRRTVADIVDVLCREFDVAREVCAADTRAFLELLVSKKVLTWTAA
jgi:Coenzyme PQQ synthesis protein D (PqqD)